jgi:DNA-binding CsgD family transcriptional regulator
MSSRAYKINNDAVLLEHNLIYVVGPIKAQNALMASYLEQDTGARCLPIENLNEVPVTGQKKPGQQKKLALFDYFGKDLEGCLLEFEVNGDYIPLVDFICLFNIARGQGIEEEAVRRGVRGVFYERDSLEQFSKGVRAIFNGELWVSRKIMTEYIVKDKKQGFLQTGDDTILTPREIEILSMIAVGFSNRKVADKLCISHHTVKTHLYKIFKKINVPTRLQAALWVAKNL